MVFARFASLLCFVGLASVCGVGAQVLRPEAAPNSVWLDLRGFGEDAKPQTVPGWVDALETEQRVVNAVGTDGAFAAPATVYRIRVGRVGDAEALLVRVYFDDLPGFSPNVSAWDELGTELARSGDFGDALGLPNAKAVVIPTAKLNYLEVTVPGDGSTVRAVHLSWLQRHELWRPLDLTSAPTVLEPFRAARTEARAVDGEDRYRHGVVTAVLQEGSLKLPQSGASLQFPFEVEKAPLVALLSFEVLGADLENPPEIRLNGRLLGDAQFAHPDLADPAIRGELQDSRAGVGFRYAGWLRATRLVPTFALSSGANMLEVTAKGEAGESAIRRVDIQLKYPFEQFDVGPVQIPSPSR